MQIAKMQFWKIQEDDQVVPVDALYFDGYDIAERVLEGMVIKVTLKDGKPQLAAKWPHGVDINYYTLVANRYLKDMAIQECEFSTTPDLEDDSGFIIFDSQNEF